MMDILYKMENASPNAKKATLQEQTAVVTHLVFLPNLVAVMGKNKSEINALPEKMAKVAESDST